MKTETCQVEPMGESLLASLGQRNAKAHQHSARFRQLFAAPLSKFWNPITGFDIVQFDDLIKPPDGQSLRACIAAKYGDEAVQLIASLIGL